MGFSDALGAGERAEQRGDFATAADKYQTALFAASDDEQRFAALAHSIRLEIARRDLSTASKYVVQSYDLRLHQKSSTELGILDVRVLHWKNDVAAAKARFGTLVPPDDARLLGEYQVERARLLDDATARRMAFREAIAKFEGIGDQREANLTRISLGHSEVIAGKYEDAENLFATTREAFLKLGDPYGQALAIIGEARAARVQERFEACHEKASQALQFAAAYPALGLDARLERALAAIDLGDIRVGIEDATNIIQDTSGTPLRRAHCYFAIGVAEAAREEFEEAHASLERAAHLYANAHSRIDVRQTILCRAAIALDAGRDADARKLLDEAPSADDPRMLCEPREAMIRARLEPTRLEQQRALRALAARRQKVTALEAHYRLTILEPRDANAREKAEALARELKAKVWLARLAELAGELDEARRLLGSRSVSCARATGALIEVLSRSGRLSRLASGTAV